MYLTPYLLTEGSKPCRGARASIYQSFEGCACCPLRYKDGRRSSRRPYPLRKQRQDLLHCQGYLQMCRMHAPDVGQCPSRPLSPLRIWLAGRDEIRVEADKMSGSGVSNWGCGVKCLGEGCLYPKTTHLHLLRPYNSPSAICG
jgi:hypothetical protein